MEEKLCPRSIAQLMLALDAYSYINLTPFNALVLFTHIHVAMRPRTPTHHQTRTCTSLKGNRLQAGMQDF